MIRIIMITGLILLISGSSISQELKKLEIKDQGSSGSFYTGCYFTVLIDPVILSTTLDSTNVTTYFLNTNIRYAFNKKFMLGSELILAFASPDAVNDPFYLAGLTFDYNLLRVERSKINFRVGISFGNLSYTEGSEPQRRTVINRVIGGSYEFRVSKVIWLYAGYYNHLPLNKIPYKYATAQPFLGACIELK